MRKSTTTPLEVKRLEGIYIEHISCGMSHTLMIARDETDEEKERIAALPSYNPVEGIFQSNSNNYSRITHTSTNLVRFFLAAK